MTASTADLVVEPAAPPVTQQRPLAYVDLEGEAVDLSDYVHPCAGGWFVWRLHEPLTEYEWLAWFQSSPPAVRPDVHAFRGDAVLEALSRYELDVRPFCDRCTEQVVAFTCAGDCALHPVSLCRECAAIHERLCGELKAGRSRMVFWED